MLMSNANANANAKRLLSAKVDAARPQKLYSGPIDVVLKLLQEVTVFVNFRHITFVSVAKFLTHFVFANSQC